VRYNILNRWHSTREADPRAIIDVDDGLDHSYEKLFILEKWTGQFIASKLDVNFILPLSGNRLLTQIKDKRWHTKTWHLYQKNKFVDSENFHFDSNGCDSFYLNPNDNELFGFSYVSSRGNYNFNKIYVFDTKTFKCKKSISFDLNEKAYKRFINDFIFVNDKAYAIISPEERDDRSLLSTFSSKGLKRQIYCFDLKKNKSVPQYELNDDDAYYTFLDFNYLVSTKIFLSPYFGKDYCKVSFYPKDDHPSTKELKFYGDVSVEVTPDQNLAVCDLTTGEIQLHSVGIVSITNQFFNNVKLPNSITKDQAFPPDIVNIILSYSGLYSPTYYKKINRVEEVIEKKSRHVPSIKNS
jgi:hypothetical protein